MKKTLLGVVCLSVLLGNGNLPVSAADAAGTTAAAVQTSESTAAQPVTPATEKKAQEKKIVINLASRSLALFEGNTKIRLYPVGVGKVNTPTPVGYYSIMDKTENPEWIDPGDPAVRVAGGDGNPLGLRWMQFYGNYGIHGTNHPESVGGYVSNGCVRLKEADIEDLYSLVSLGTPVEITYNRVVVEKISDHTIVYYIYPDGYNQQSLDVQSVSKWLAGYGVGAFESDADIAAKIQASDGQPTYVAKAYALELDGKKIADKAVIKNDICYLPATALAEALKISLTWQPEANVLVSPYGKSTGYLKKDVLYCNADDVGVLFHLAGGLNEQQSAYVLHSVTASDGAAASAKPADTAASAAGTPADPAKNNVKIEQQPVQTEKPVQTQKPATAADSSKSTTAAAKTVK